jgi:hypothetical protein
LLALAIVVGALLLDRRHSNRDGQDDEAQRVATPTIPASQDIDSTPPDAEFPRNSGTNFRIRRTILLPSVAFPGATESGESPTEGSQGGRSTGLLSRYRQTHQE